MMTRESSLLMAFKQMLKASKQDNKKCQRVFAVVEASTAKITD